MSLRFLLPTTVLPLVPITVLAGEMPKEGTDSFTNTWLITTSNTMKVGDRTLGTYEVSGVHQDVQGDATTDMGMRCLGIYDVAGKARAEHGESAGITEIRRQVPSLTYEQAVELHRYV